MHHPLMSNGSHGGQFSIEKQIFPLEQKIPLPVIGSFINLLRKTTGPVLKISKQTIHCLCKTHQNSLQSQDNVIVVSGHDHNLQLLIRIISNKSLVVQDLNLQQLEL
jgi:hypothetical protein